MGSESGIVIRSGGDDLNTRWAGSLPPHRFFPTRIALQDTRNPVSWRTILVAQKMVVGKVERGAI